MTLGRSAKSSPNKLKSHNFAIFCFFGGTRKIVYAKVHWIFQNPPRKPQSHQNSDFLGILGTPRDTEYPWGEGANEQKTNKRMKRVCLVKSEICDVICAFLSFSENLKIRVRQVHWDFQNPERNVKNPSNSRFLMLVCLRLFSVLAGLDNL